MEIKKIAKNGSRVLAGVAVAGYFAWTTIDFIGTAVSTTIARHLTGSTRETARVVLEQQLGEYYNSNLAYRVAHLGEYVSLKSGLTLLRL